ncbi:hypothetical protein A3Q56_07551 [Intoshia linei]|uniref:Uncharacterized protein n=1 Tax=Intoshia linei TaxID=1819745 RepID=A0A177ARQ8_9BILA|nr:hypothetical protein A3Q56_07551 [Intoshia linei]
MLNSSDLPWYCFKTSDKFLDFITFDFKLAPWRNCFAARNSLFQKPPTYNRGVIRVPYDDSKLNLESLDVENRALIVTKAINEKTQEWKDKNIHVLMPTSAPWKRTPFMFWQFSHYDFIDLIRGVPAVYALLPSMQLYDQKEVIAILPQMNAPVKDLPMILKSIHLSNPAKRYDMYKNVFAYLEEPKVNTVSFHGSGIDTIKAYNLITHILWNIVYDIHEYKPGDSVVPTKSLIHHGVTIYFTERMKPQGKTKISPEKKNVGSCNL